MSYASGNGLQWILPGLIIIGWILSWPRRRRVRWQLLGAAVIVCVACFVIGFAAPGISPFVLASGVAGLLCVIFLTVVTAVVDVISQLRPGRRRGSG